MGPVQWPQHTCAAHVDWVCPYCAQQQHCFRRSLWLQSLVSYIRPFIMIPFWMRSFCIPGVCVLTMRELCVQPASPWRVSGGPRVLSLFSSCAWFAFSCRSYWIRVISSPGIRRSVCFTISYMVAVLSAWRPFSTLRLRGTARTSTGPFSFNNYVN